MNAKETRDLCMELATVVAGSEFDGRLPFGCRERIRRFLQEPDVDLNLHRSREDNLLRAQKLATENGRTYEVWEHVGDYGRPQGDIPARHTFAIKEKGADKTPDWAMIALVSPGEAISTLKTVTS